MNFRKNLFYKFLENTLQPYVLSLIKEVNGTENIPKTGPFVVVANHESYIDPLLVKGYLSRDYRINVYYLTKIEAFDNPFKKYFFDSVGSIPVDRGAKDEDVLKGAVDVLKQNGIIGIFPEGTRSRDGKLHKGKTGAVRLALAAKCKILPIGINNTYELWPPNQKLPKRRKEVVVNIGKPISLDKYYDTPVTKELLRGLTDMVMAEIGKLCGQEYKVED